MKGPLLTVLHALLRQRARRKFASFAPLLPPACRLLDIGAGEGFVGACAAAAGHTVELVDTVDRNQSDLPFQLYDGQRLPYAAASFDVGVLSYVLHHCDDARQVLSEAARVCRSLVVLESVFEQLCEERLLRFLDHSANRLRGMPPEALHFKTPAGWWLCFDALGLRVRHFSWLGRLVHKHVLFLVEPAEPVL